jgi:4-hydroxy-2-oxoheptanedioate aldolase
MAKAGTKGSRAVVDPADRAYVSAIPLVEATMQSPEPTAAPLNRLRAVWRGGRCTLGAIVTIPSVQLIQVMARSGLDWVLIDMEHGAIDAAAAHAMIAATTGTPLVPFVRVSATTTWQAKLPLDLGAMGICFPMTTRRADAEAAVRAVRYPPRGERYWGPFYAPLRWDLSMRDYLDRADDELLAIGTIEHLDALQTIGEVVATPGLDLVFIGPGDLATSMGLKGRPEHPDVQDAMRRLEEAILESPVLLGGVAPTPEQANAMIARGYRALVVGFDWSLLQRGIAAAIAGVQR